MPLARAAFLLPALLWVAASFSQVRIQGRVLDARTQEPLAFVHVVPEGQRDGTTTDIDGRFALNVDREPVILRFSYVGYVPTEISARSGAPLSVEMPRAMVELKPVEIRPGVNPAHRIIDRVYANRKLNDGLRNRAHRYTSYSKTIFTAAMDSAVLNNPEELAKLDTSDKEMVDWLDKQHLLLIESATKKSFIPPASEKEEVIAMRVSGLKDPTLLALAASTKTFSVYEPQIPLQEKTYLSPIGPSSTARYLFILQDTLYQGKDTVFIISYEPMPGRKFDALKGVLYVSTDGFALQNVIAEPVERTGNFNIKLQQQFEKVGGQAWFPVQLNTFLYLDMMQVNSFKVIGIGRTYLKNIEVDAPIPRKEVRGPELVMDRIATRRDEDFWNAVRTDSLEAKELRTYHTIDSISEAENVERMVKWFSYLATGRAGIGPVDILLDRVVNYNGYEGIRLGLGAATNDKISRHASLGGYFAYGFKDRDWKYGGDLTLRLKPGHGPTLRPYYAYDVEESGSVAFQGAPRTFSSESYRWIYVDRMDRVERFGGELAFRVNSALKMWLGTERTERQNLIGYQYAEPLSEEITYLTDRFLTGSVSMGLRFAFREQVASLPDRQVPLGTRWPILYLNATQAVDGLWDGEWEVWRVNAMVEKTFRLRMMGDLSLRVMGGMAEEGTPYPFLFNLRGTYSTKVPIGTANTFETMRPNEYLADRYVAIHARHSFGNLLFKGKKFRPVPVLLANAAWGALSSPERQQGYTFSELEGGFYEGGIQLDNLLRSGFVGFGAGFYYRLGPNAFPDPSDNMAVKLTMGFGR